MNFDQRAIDQSRLWRMVRSLAHRGPDDEGIFVDPGVGLGHRRLAVIDCSAAGHQPMETADGRYVISYNGEIYNFRELRRELEAKGQAFRSQTDSEVALLAYVSWGSQAVERFNGMFALAIWDRHERSLFLARDRYGTKPLYYRKTQNALCFASEVKGILASGEAEAQVNPAALLEYFTFQNVFSDQTIFKDIHQFPPGHWALCNVETGRLDFHRYWDFLFSETRPAPDPKAQEEELYAVFNQAVTRQLVADVPIGGYLSGGIDSSGITAIAAAKIKGLSSFTCGFDLSSASGLELNFDERQQAEALSGRFKTSHYEIILKAGDLESVMPELVWHLEDLRVGQCYPNYYVAKLASRFSKVVLSGTGGDEIFAGYPWRYFSAANSSTFDDFASSYYRYWQRLIPNQVIQRLFQPEIWASIKEVMTVDIFRDILKAHRLEGNTPETYIGHSLYLECKTFLRGLLTVEDKLSMAHGLETRVPFLDNDLVDFAQKIPVSQKLRGFNPIKIDENLLANKPDAYTAKNNDGKILLRNMLRRVLPEDTVSGPKQGFSGPDASWFKGESIDYVRALILDQNARIYQFLRPDTVAELVNQHLSGQVNRRLLIWSLLCFEWWCRLFLDQHSEIGPPFIGKNARQK